MRMSITVLSLLDRLLDDQPEQTSDRPASGAELIMRLRRSVHRDVEALLNARRPWRSIRPDLPALRQSPVGYGLPDFTAGAFNDRRQREVLRSEIETTLRLFEPRLAEVHVHLAEDAAPLSTTLMLRIDALLLTDPAPEPIIFDTALDITTSDMLLQPMRDA